MAKINLNKLVSTEQFAKDLGELVADFIIEGKERNLAQFLNAYRALKMQDKYYVIPLEEAIGEAEVKDLSKHKVITSKYLENFKKIVLVPRWEEKKEGKASQEDLEFIDDFMKTIGDLMRKMGVVEI